MNQANAKLFRRIFKDRKQYRAYKKSYAEAGPLKQKEALKVCREIVASGKKVNVL